MEKIMMKIDDIVQSPDGLIKIIKFHKNGITLVERLYEPYGTFNIFSKAVRKYPIVSQETKHKTFERGSMAPAYTAWQSVRRRSARVCTEWTDYQVFAEWFYRTRNTYPDWQSMSHGWAVAFDLLDPANRTASPETCCVVPFPVLTALSGQRGRSRSNDLPRGVTSMANRFAVHCSRFDTGQRRIGSYDTKEAASAAYWSAKIEAIRYTGIVFWSFIPEPLAMRMVQFGPADIVRYFGTDHDTTGPKISK